MKNEKKELVKGFKTILEDVMDNYEEYTDEEKAQIKDLFQKLSELNVLLDKYDLVTDLDWTAYFASVSFYFGAN